MKTRLHRASAACCWWLGCSLALLWSPAAADTLVADLSRHLIAITADFDGTELLLFGTVEAGDDVVVVIQGPPETVVVRRKSKRLGIWLNRHSARFPDAPSFYAVAASGDLETLLDEAVRTRHQMGVNRLQLPTEPALEPRDLASFRAGLLRNKQALGLYPRVPVPVRFVGAGLFRTTIVFPATVRPGRYRVEVFSLRDGRIRAAQQSALIITKVGLEEQLSVFARRDASLYGLGAIAFAVTAGWVAAVAFRRN